MSKNVCIFIYKYGLLHHHHHRKTEGLNTLLITKIHKIIQLLSRDNRAEDIEIA